jgi:hypothetical protein
MNLFNGDSAKAGKIDSNNNNNNNAREIKP